MYAATTPRSVSSRESVMIAKSMFQRTISGWASDVLGLRPAGLGPAVHAAVRRRRMCGPGAPGAESFGAATGRLSPLARRLRGRPAGSPRGAIA